MSPNEYQMHFSQKRKRPQNFKKGNPILGKRRIKGDPF